MRKIKGERSARMIALGERKKKAYEDSLSEKKWKFFFEERAQIEGKGCYDRTYKRVYENCTRNRKIFLIVS